MYIIKPDGVLVIRVPNLDSWDERLFRTSWAGYDAPRHLYIFRPKTLSAMLEQQGFQVVDHSTAISSYMVFALDVRNWATARRFSATPEAMALFAALAGAVSVVAGLFGSLEFDTPSGPSIVVAALAVFLLTLAPLGAGREAGT